MADANVVMTQQLLQYMREATVPSPSVWQERTLFLKEWLLLNTSLQNIPDDGTEDVCGVPPIVVAQNALVDYPPPNSARGPLPRNTQSLLDTFGYAIMSATSGETHGIVCELREVAVVKLVDAPSDGDNVSPSRGKLRPGKDLVVLPSTDVPNLTLPDGVDDASGGASARDGSARLGRPPSIPKDKSFSGMSMMERQAEWLRKKQEKVEAEEKRQRDEKEKELTFKPDLVKRRVSLTMSDKPDEKPKPAVKQNSFNEKKLPSSESVTKAASFKEPKAPPADTPEKQRPVSRSLVEKPTKVAKAPSFKKKKSASKGVDAKLEVTSHLLNSMKSELKASKAMKLDAADGGNDQDQPNEEPKEDGDDGDDGGDDDNDDDDETPLLPEATTGEYKIDFSGMETKARLVLQDASLFELNSMYRKTDKGAGREGVALQMGRREDNHEEQVVAVIFDKEKISEGDAQKWWQDHKARFFEMEANNA
ncbi:Aste57867_22923 [Aphanomyces stellatus]|uniref:Aste57867_22923 protein n=1 Tax=Aphanomyces stellatus TaxID=120398 RepID=A0A485LLA9_9STRA|nr:hypothetical protein As57867_022852 [Aphanomyces stellatus]VFT99573.1 Aste57867_22923 [Aphanomyces stellatus]